MPKRISPQLNALILAVALPFAGVMGYVWHKAVQESSAAATELPRLTSARVVDDVSRMHRQSEWKLAQLAASPEVRRLRPQACKDEARLLRRLHPEFINLIIWDRARRMVCSAMPIPPDAEPAGNLMPVFGRTIEEKRFQVSDVFFGEIAKEHLVLFTYPILDEQGEAVGVLSAGVSLRHFDEMLAGLDLPVGSAIAVLDRNLTFIARTPGGERWRGQSAKRLAIDKVPAAGARSAGLVRGIDGVERLYVEEKVQEAGWKVFAGIPSERLLARHRDWLVFSMAVTLLVLAAGGIAAYAIAARLARRFDAMLRAEQDLMARLMRAEEQERARISRELHDQVGQELTALALDLKCLRAGAQPQVVERAIAAAGRLIDEVRDVSLALRPSQLDDLGLVAALRAHAERHLRAQGTRVHLDTEVDDGRLSTTVEVACFRIVQEALTNVLRHAEAGNVWIRLRTERSQLVLVVHDDGRGFDVDAALESAGELRSLGLRNLSDRARLAGGQLEIHSSPGDGTLVTARLPL